MIILSEETQMKKTIITAAIALALILTMLAGGCSDDSALAGRWYCEGRAEKISETIQEEPASIFSEFGDNDLRLAGPIACFTDYDRPVAADKVDESNIIGNDIEILKDGTAIAGGRAFTWKIENNRLYFTYFGFMTEVFNYKFSNSRLTLVDDYGNSWTYEKQ
jgi:hypothetical protein